MKKTFRIWPAAVVVVGLVAASLSISGSQADLQRCGVSAAYDVCLVVPDGPLTGDVRISTTFPNASQKIENISYLDFSWGPTETATADLVTDFEYPYEFTWPTGKYLDVTQYLNVRVVTKMAVTGDPVSVELTLDNDNATTIEANPVDWEQVFKPGLPPAGDPVTVGIGDAASGRTLSDDLIASVRKQDPSLLLYLGDVYERGTYAENLNYYGRASFDDLAGGVRWGSLAERTRPTLGNHEAHNVAAWRDYWHGLPLYSSFDFGGVHYLDLNSECYRSEVGGCGPGSPQYEFVRQDLANNQLSCVVAYWHKPVLSAFPETTAMKPLWSLLANNGGDLVLNGHAHDMQQYAPMNAALETGKPDSHMVELISGAGGHRFATAVNTDPRHVWQLQNVAGAVYMTAVGGRNGAASRLDWVFKGIDGNRVHPTDGSGSVGCGAAATVPDAPTGVTAAAGNGSATVSWNAPQSDGGSPISGYTVTSSPGGITARTDDGSARSVTVNGLTNGTSYTFTVKASNAEGAGPESDPSNAVTPQASVSGGTKAVSVTDSGYSPNALGLPAQGYTVQWNFASTNTRAHTATDSSGMNLFDSGVKAAGTSYPFVFNAAGTYAYRSTASEPTSITGRIKVPLKVTPLTGGTDTTYTVTWASAAPPPDFFSQVQVRSKPCGKTATCTWSAWSPWMTNQTSAISAGYIPTNGAGTYQFRARLGKQVTETTKKFCLWSAPVTVSVT